jgi:hypothetical protein
LSDQTTEKIQAHIRLTLMDHLRLQLWCRWIFLPRTLVVFLGSAAIAAVALTLANGGTLDDIAHGLFANSTLYTFALVLGFLVIMVLIPLIGSIRWLMDRRPHEMTFHLDDNGVGYSGGGIDVTVRWENIVAYSATAASVLVRCNRLLLRLPKRAFSQDQIQAIAALFAHKGVHRVPAWQFNWTGSTGSPGQPQRPSRSAS